MLRPPYRRYDRLYVYHLKLAAMPAVDDPDLVGAWLEDGHPIFFFHRPKERLIADLCRTHHGTVIYQADLDYREWEAGHEIVPFTVHDLTVAPLWSEGPADIRLDPSVIFGSGFHPSTRLCLEALLDYLDAPELAIRTALDLGCGTGLLAVAAAKQGVERVEAIDNNSLACEVAAANAERNGVGDRVRVRCLDLHRELPDTGVDLLVANLYHGLLAELFANDAFWQAGLAILAGFISPMEAELLAALPADRLRFLERRRQDKWCLWVIQPRS